MVGGGVPVAKEIFLAFLRVALRGLPLPSGALGVVLLLLCTYTYEELTGAKRERGRQVRRGRTEPEGVHRGATPRTGGSSVTWLIVIAVFLVLVAHG
jgi:hypothetical protein